MIRRRRTFALAFGMAITSCLIGWASHSSNRLTSAGIAPTQTAALQTGTARPTPVKPANRLMTVRKIATLEDERINESSGVAASRMYPGYLWTHNDSGDSARLFLIATNGKTLRNTLLGNFLDWCGVSMPCGRGDADMPVGFLLSAPANCDEALLSAALAIEPVVQEGF